MDAVLPLDETVCERARLARDARFDGRFFVGVRTTGIYCRPTCPAVTARRENVSYFATAAAAAEAGLRPCLRCRPESAPGTPAWAGTSTTVRRGLALIEAGALDGGSVEALGARLGVTGRHLRRLFTAHLGASPLAVAHTRRLHFAKRLIDDTAMPMADVAAAAGFGSVRRFNDALRNAYGRTPRELRRLRRRIETSGALTVRLPCRQPYSFAAVMRYYGLRAIPGVEAVDGECYRRALAIDGQPAIVEVREERGSGLALTLTGVPAARLYDVMRRARQVFDSDAPMADIGATLAGDGRLAPLLAGQPGVRVPGAWDGFELAVRAILGQQISVKAATTIAGRIVARYGTPLPEPAAGLTHLFPDARALGRARFDGIGLVRSRADTLRRLAAAVAAGDVDFDPLQDARAFRQRLTAIKGIGEWTAAYVMMRALKDPDALPAADLGLLKALVPGRRVTPAELEQRAERWRPWRSYAAMLLWGAAPAAGE